MSASFMLVIRCFFRSSEGIEWQRTRCRGRGRITRLMVVLLGVGQGVDDSDDEDHMTGGCIAHCMV